MRKLTLLDWCNLGITGILIAGVFLPWTHGFFSPPKPTPPGFSPFHNGLDELNAGAGFILLTGSLLGLLLWLGAKYGPGPARLVAPVVKLMFGGLMVYMVKIYYDDFDYSLSGFTVQPGFWVTLAGLLLWLGRAVVELARNFRQVGRAKTLVN